MAGAAASPVAGAGDQAEMTLSEIERLAALAEEACAAVAGRPDEEAPRETLFDTLAPLVNPDFVDGNGNRPPYLHGLLRQACVQAEILRDRIVEGRKGRRSGAFETMNIGGGARDLRRLLSALIDAIGAAGRP